MSLKTFHIVFVVCSTALAFFCGAWLLWEYLASGQKSELAAAAVSFLGGAALIWYGRIVLRKLRHLTYL